MLEHLAGVTPVSKTLRAKKICKLFGENGVGIDKIKYVICSANEISKLTNAQIQNVIDISPRNPFPRKPHVTSKIADAEAVEYDEPGDDDYNVTLLQRVSTGEIRSR
ncbi:hypothetical protein RirG_070180 [Rhizophagus irregularis DAOM 197198w]|uniref:Uncharacterized protein n=2 Tax=Rhizophagus irregularis TaxID=588596 RepID=A0A015MZW5_RHIIW|nr:hypothetical protein RirG_070180 [Rhizophagus irregularis DAOM 197198w]